MGVFEFGCVETGFVALQVLPTRYRGELLGHCYLSGKLSPTQHDHGLTLVNPGQRGNEQGNDFLNFGERPDQPAYRCKDIITKNDWLSGYMGCTIGMRHD